MSNDDKLKEIRKNYTLDSVFRFFNKVQGLNVCVIGDTIIDEYVFVNPKGRAVKDPILSVEYINNEEYAGGILAIANHISDFVKNVKLVTLVGDRMTNMELIKSTINKNIELKTFVKENSPTILKKRYIDHYRNNKLFKIEYMNDRPIEKNLSAEIVNYLTNELPKYDLVIVGDFGHGFINDPIRRVLEEKSAFLAVNVQSNSSNMGFNYINQYKKADFVSMAKEELRLAMHRRFEDLQTVIKEACAKLKFNPFIVTLGKDGSVYVRDDKLFNFPIITAKVKDTVGAGDALFAITTLFVFGGADDKLVPFMANCAGGLAANFMGNKEYITKEKLQDFVGEILQ